MKVSIGGKDRTIYGNVNGLIELKKEHNVDIVNGFSQENFSFEAVRSLVFVALKHGHKRDSGKFDHDFTVEDVGEWLTPANMNTIMGSVLKAYVGDIEVKGEPGTGE